MLAGKHVLDLKWENVTLNILVLGKHAIMSVTPFLVKIHISFRVAQENPPVTTV
jgi:hypothetical protein